MNLNKELYDKILGDGLNIQSPADAEISQASDQLSTAIEELEQLSALGVDVDDAIASLQSTQSELDGASSHINNQKPELTRQLGQADMVNRLDAVGSDIPSGCFNTAGSTGMITGGFNDLFSGIGSGAADISKAIARYLNGEISESELLALLGGLTSSMGGLVASIGKAIAGENSLLAELARKVSAMSLSQQLSGLWGNPCSQAVLDQTLPEDVKDLL
ncbi:hypothetical protein GZ77_26080 [Endozoicomonas montiporae]|uniref:DUF7217 domain-containing protein n=1 Tax=Endozoicomonas montiporae TaxID=1027273 RepID=A0A081MYL1_9GAMM|nr:hypothetical protein [Endozoicomonas montiporae]KEQ11284.1 hypothetical protein GZ77_26080 [Endozoicomonas montiporae]